MAVYFVIAIAIFSFLLLLLIASTGYDVYQTVILGNDPKRINKMFQSFSVITNTRELVTVAVPDDIKCLHGVRSFAMLAVIVYHTFGQYNCRNDCFVTNPIYFSHWKISPQGVCFRTLNVNVQTFFVMSGLLVVYTTAGKLTRPQLMKNLHMFYLNRWLRLLPALAAVVLIQALILNPTTHASKMCRTLWWYTLLCVQNWIFARDMCLFHTWYLAVDTQLYFISPVVLFWELGGRKHAARIALAGGFILSLVGATIFIINFQYTIFNTLLHSSSFFIGMFYGHVLHLNRRRKLRLSNILVGILWVCAIIGLFGFHWIHYLIVQVNWGNLSMYNVSDLITYYLKIWWALAVGWVVLACHHGYGGPVGWLLSLRCFTVLSRLSYAMYLVHPLLHIHYYTDSLKISFFAPSILYFESLVDISQATVASFLLTLLVVSPSTKLIKHFMSEGRKPPASNDITDSKKLICKVSQMEIKKLPMVTMALPDCTNGSVV